MTVLFCIVVPVVVAYLRTLYDVGDAWLRTGSYWSHGPLVPVVMAAVIWMRRNDPARGPAAYAAGGWWLLLPALSLHLAGAALMVDSLSAASLVLAVPGTAWLAFGRARLVGLWPALWFTAFAIPLPIFVSGQLVFMLKEFVVDTAITLGNAAGVELQRRSAEILVPGQAKTLFVADPCGGLNSLLSLLTLGYCVAFFVGSSHPMRRALLLLVAAPIAILVNVLRVTGICLLAHRYGVPWAASTGHSLLNIAEWVAALALLFVVDLAVSRWLRRRGSA